MDTRTIKELQTHEEILEAFPVMNQLRTHLDEKTYIGCFCPNPRKGTF